MLGDSAFLAGLIDAVVGGGGLIQLPLLLAVFPFNPIPVLFGTIKISSICGTSSAALHYSRKVAIPFNASSACRPGRLCNWRSSRILPCKSGTTSHGAADVSCGWQLHLPKTGFWIHRGFFPCMALAFSACRDSGNLSWILGWFFWTGHGKLSVFCPCPPVRYGYVACLGIGQRLLIWRQIPGHWHTFFCITERCGDWSTDGNCHRDTGA